MQRRWAKAHKKMVVRKVARGEVVLVDLLDQPAFEEANLSSWDESSM